MIPAVLLALAAQAQDPLSVRADSVAPRHDARHYDVALVLPDTGSVLRGSVTTRWRLESGAPLRIDLDTVYTVERVTLDGLPATWRRAGFQLYVDHGGRAGQDVTTEVEYHGVPADGLAIRGAGPARTIFADNWPDRARKWLPMQDHPGDKATVSWTITAPAEFTVVAVGRLDGVESVPGARVWRFSMAEPTPVHTMVVGAATLATATVGVAGCPARCVPVSVVSYPADSAWAVDGPFRRAPEMIDLFTRLFGPFPYGELRHVESSTIFGGMENSTAIFYDERAWRNRRLGEGTVAHETAHQWFGDAVSQSDWHHLWLSEGFATYGAALWAEHTGGPDGLRRQMQQAARVVRGSEVKARPILDPAESRLMSLLSANNYQKGSWVLHSLRGLVGDSAFFRGVRAYYAEFQHGNTLSRDFARVMQRESGQDLEWYFRQALIQPGFPVLEVHTAAAGDSVALEVRQSQPEAWGTYRMPGLVVDLAGTRVTLDVGGRVTRRTVPKPAAWTGGATLDPDGWWLFELKEPAAR